ncbi:MAG TPA: CARDB domain-containing protein, partial [Thermoanaerobaculaceae bacterium]|nr:CARDB domain-containing protein [Thermoanaerobaculaceae bacterium]
PLEIWQIQGTVLESLYKNQVVTTQQNVVTAVEAAGFFIQTPEQRSDGNPETSDGVYVYTGNAPWVQVGDMVDVSGTVKEYYALTEISAPVVVKTSSGNPLPAPVDLDATRPSPSRPQPLNEVERYEGMLVRVQAGTASGPTDKFGELAAVARPGRAFREPGIYYPAPAGLPAWDGNPEVFLVKPTALGLPDAQVPAGATFTATGPLYYSFDQYKIYPTAFTFTGEPTVRLLRERTQSEYLIASQNLYQLLDDVDDPAITETVVTTEEYQRRLAKHSMLIRDVLHAPDILAVQEAESLKVLQDLALRIHADEPALTYTPYLVEGNDISGIDVGFLVRGYTGDVSIEQVGKAATFMYNGASNVVFDRPPLVLHTRLCYRGIPVTCPTVPVTIINVHLRSLSGMDTSSGDFVRAKRFEGAKWLAQYVQSLQVADPTVSVAVIGDFNAFEFTDGNVDVMGMITGHLDPAGAFLPGSDWVNPDLHNHTWDVPQPERYSYIEAGSSQVLDHLLTTSAMTPMITEVAYAHVNADMPAALAADPSTPLRAADHDPVAVFLSPEPRADLAVSAQAAPGTVATGGLVTCMVSVRNNGPFGATGVSLGVSLPAGLTVEAVTPSQGSCVEHGLWRSCGLESLASGATATVTFSVRLLTRGQHTLTFVTDAFEPDPVVTNNEAAAAMTALARARRHITR